MVGNTIMKIIILSYANSTQINSASYNRTMSYIVGLKKSNYNISLLYASHPLKEIERRGKINEIDYEFIGKDEHNKNKLVKIFNNFKLFDKTCKQMKREKDANKKLIVGIPVGNPFLSVKYVDFCHKNGIFTFQERSEFPNVILKTKGIKKIIKTVEYKYYLMKVLPRIDFIIVMTKTLIEHYSKLVGKNAKLYHMPMTVEVERFQNIIPFNPGYKYIAYCGTMNKDKDGVHILIEAFHKIVLDNLELKLILIGPKEPETDYNEIKKYISDNKIEDKVDFIGTVDRIEIPKYLCGAEALCLARPESIQAQGGFPTKLGEYLLTGKPVVVTKVGEIPNYLSDSLNCFLAEPNDIDSFYNKLLEAITYEDRQKIGMKGRETAMNVFNSLVQSKKLGEFFEQNI